MSKYFLKKIENKKDEKFWIDKFYISNKEIENLFREKNI